jgi:hypothetical protein
MTAICPHMPLSRFIVHGDSPSGMFSPMQFPMARQVLNFFEGYSVRKVWDDAAEKWYFSVVDIVAVLAEPTNPRKYWSVLKMRLKAEGSEVTTFCSQLKLLSPDGKMHRSDVLDTEGILRLIQSIPSKNAEPFKIWLARVGRERIDEIDDPELAINRAMKTYERKGYSKEWTNLRLKSIDVRKELTDEWENRGVKQGHEFAILTDDITQAWAGMTTKVYKKFKDLKQESLRDNMSNVELVLNMLAEVSTTEISKAKQPETFPENRRVAKEGGAVAGKARRALESQTGKSVITSQKFSDHQIADNQPLNEPQKLGDGETGSQPLPLPPN